MIAPNRLRSTGFRSPLSITVLAIAALSTATPEQAAADPLRLRGSGISGISIDGGATLAPEFEIRFEYLIDEADVMASGGMPPGSFHFDLEGALSLFAGDEPFLASPVVLGFDLFLMPPTIPGEFVYEGSLYVQEFSQSAFSDAIPNVPATAEARSFENRVRVGSTRVVPVDSSPEALFLFFVGGGGVEVEDVQLRGEYNPSFAFFAPLDSFEASAVPEPAAALLAAFGLALALAVRARR